MIKFALFLILFLAVTQVASALTPSEEQILQSKISTYCFTGKMVFEYNNVAYSEIQMNYSNICMQALQVKAQNDIYKQLLKMNK